MTLLTAAERAKLKRFDPARMPRFAAQLGGLNELGDIVDPASPYRAWLYRPDWQAKGLDGFFDRQATLPREDTMENIGRHWRVDGRPKKEPYDAILKGEVTRIHEIFNSGLSRKFMRQCDRITRQVMQALPILTRGDCELQFTHGDDRDREWHYDDQVIVATLVTEGQGTLIPDPGMMEARGIDTRIDHERDLPCIQALLDMGIDIYEADIGTVTLLRGRELAKIAAVDPDGDYASWHMGGQTAADLPYSRPAAVFGWDLTTLHK